MAEEIAGDAPSVAASDSGDAGTSSDTELSRAKKPRKKGKKAKKAKKVAKRLVKRAAAEGDDSPSGGAAPAKQAKKAKKAKKATAKRAKKAEASEAVESASKKADSDSDAEGGSSRVSYGRRPRRSGPELIQPDEQGRSSASVPKAAAVASKPAAEETDSDRSGGDEDSDGRDSQGDRRGGRRRRGRRGRSRVEGRDRPDSRGEGARPDSSRPARGRSEGGRPDRNRSDSNRPDRRPKKATSSKTPRETVESASLTVERMLSDTWTEDKARKFLSDGFLSSLSPDILDSESKDLSGAPELEQPLRTIRRVLADECMVEDDATDVILLDIVVKALSDWTLVYRIKAKDGALDEIERLMDIRSKADRRLMEAIAALKNS